MTNTSSVYQNIAERTDGNVYIGVVGPVRTGKSAFIKRFMELLVLPNIEDVYERERARDELPQSGSGRTIMTAEPKFIPENGVNVTLESGGSCSVRLVDCVGYMVNGAAGQLENGEERLVMTPWSDEEMPITRAAEEGTRRVIAEHSSIAILVTTDGSICGIERSEYIEAESRAAEELTAAGKPFVMLLNCALPQSDEAAALAKELSERYGAVCMPVNCLEMSEGDMASMLENVLREFPVDKVRMYLPAWADALDMDCDIKKDVFAVAASAAKNLVRIRDTDALAAQIAQCRFISGAEITEIGYGSGEVSINVEIPRALYYETISKESGFDIRNDGDLVQLLKSISGLKQEYERVHEALEEVREKGYGIVMPTPDELRLEEPEIVKQGGRYGVRLKASAPAIHMLMTNIETEVSPALGGEKASEEIINFLLEGFDGDVNRIWESNIFGKSLYDIAGEGLSGKITRLPPETRLKLRDTLQRIINEGSGGLICIIL